MLRDIQGLNGGINVGTEQIKALFYADDLILLAPTREQLQPLIQATETWTRRHKLTINTKKSVYVVYNKLETAPIVINNAAMIPQSTSSYLGFVKKSRDVNIHLKTRITKAKRATFAVMSMLRKLPEL